MNGITFGKFHTFRAWGLLMQRHEITPPIPRRRKVQILGRHGSLDISKALTGEVMYDNRTLTAEFVLMSDRSTWKEMEEEVYEAIHGKELRIVLDDDPNFYYTGFVEVAKWQPGHTTVAVTITADLDPHKHRNHGGGVKM